MALATPQAYYPAKRHEDDGTRPLSVHSVLRLAAPIQARHGAVSDASPDGTGHARPSVGRRYLLHRLRAACRAFAGLARGSKAGRLSGSRRLGHDTLPLPLLRAYELDSLGLRSEVEFVLAPAISRENMTRWILAAIFSSLAAFGMENATSFSGTTVVLISSLSAVLVASIPELLRMLAKRGENKRAESREGFLSIKASQDKVLELEDQKEARNFQQAQELLIKQATFYEEAIKREREMSARELGILQRDNEGLKELNKCQSDLIETYKSQK